MMAASFLSSIAGVVVGSAIAHTFFGGAEDAGEAGDAHQDVGPDAGDMDGDIGGDFGDFGGDL